jgi:hypothetical protein
MHPLHPRNFGSDATKISIRFYNGTSLVDGYIVKQLGTRRFIVSDGTITKTVSLARNSNDARLLSRDLAPFGSNTLTTVQDMATIVVTDGLVRRFVDHFQTLKVWFLDGMNKPWIVGSSPPSGGVTILTRSGTAALNIDEATINAADPTDTIFLGDII